MKDEVWPQGPSATTDKDSPETAADADRMMRRLRIATGVELPHNAVVQAAKDTELARALAAGSTLPGCHQNQDR